MIHITAYARLHLGFFDMHGGLGRKFGSLGVALAEPKIQLSATLSDKLVISGDLSDAQQCHIADTVSGLQQQLGVSNALAIQVNQLIPSHAGLGSGTQIKLALLTLINELNQLHLDNNVIAKYSGRGARSGIGLATFRQGGVVVDAGRGETDTLPPVVSRLDFPEAWRILLIFDRSFQGVHGESELTAFKKLPEFPESLAGQLCRHVLMQGLPALIEGDLQAFGATVSVLQKATGQHFSQAQGGIYASKKVANILNYLEKNGVACVGQSSWGPTGFAMFENEQLANQALTHLGHDLKDEGLDFMLTCGINHGALINDSGITKK